MTLVLGGTGKTGRRVVERLRARGVPTLFTEVLDRRNAKLADGVQRALGREPRDFGDYARRTAATGIWDGGR
jgi:uncharacterized protein YbjT (DUF2867 family)